MLQKLARHLVIAAATDDISHPGILVGPAEHGSLSGHRVQRSPHALVVLAASAHHVHHAWRLVPAEIQRKCHESGVGKVGGGKKQGAKGQVVKSIVHVVVSVQKKEGGGVGRLRRYTASFRSRRYNVTAQNIYHVLLSKREHVHVAETAR